MFDKEINSYKKEVEKLMIVIGQDSSESLGSKMQDYVYLYNPEVVTNTSVISGPSTLQPQDSLLSTPIWLSPQESEFTAPSSIQSRDSLLSQTSVPSQTSAQNQGLAVDSIPPEDGREIADDQTAQTAKDSGTQNLMANSAVQTQALETTGDAIYLHVSLPSPELVSDEVQALPANTDVIVDQVAVPLDKTNVEKESSNLVSSTLPDESRAAQEAKKESDDKRITKYRKKLKTSLVENTRVRFQLLEKDRLLKFAEQEIAELKERLQEMEGGYSVMKNHHLEEGKELE